MHQIHRYAAFTATPSGGNPAGVILDADHLEATEMQQIASDVGYSETAFVLRNRRDGGDYGLRFFSPLAEVPFCGHATIATSIALAEAGARGPFRFATGAGDIVASTTRAGGRLSASLRSVPGHSRPVSSGALSAALDALAWSAEDLDPSFPSHVAYAGAHHLVLVAKTRQRLADLSYDFPALKGLSEREGWTTLQLIWPETSTVFHSRNPFPIGGVVEDPATGAAAAAFGAYLRETGRVSTPTTFTLLQGEDMGRPSEISVRVVPAEAEVTVSGSAVRMAVPGTGTTQMPCGDRRSPLGPEIHTDRLVGD